MAYVLWDLLYDPAKLRSSPFPIPDAFLSTVFLSSHINLEFHTGRAGGLLEVTEF